MKNQGRFGIAAVEFALIVPLFLLLLAGIIEFGQAFYIKHSLSIAARRGARASIVEGATTYGVTQKVRTDCHLILGVDESDVQVHVIVNGGAGADLSQAESGDEVTVMASVSYSDAGVGFYANLMSSSPITASCTLEHE
jgi:Flp pilus assembly protein TadG